jgi:hypothetical protein
MKQMLLVVAVATVALVADVRPGAARDWYPWCAQYADIRAITECAFTSFQQCQATLSGIGGSCVQNPRPAPGGPAGPRRDRPWQPFYR